MREHGEGRPRLLEQVRRAARARQYSPRTEEAYAGWVRRYVLYHGKRHPAELDGEHGAEFLTHLAVERRRKRTGVAVALSRNAHAVGLLAPYGMAQETTKPHKAASTCPPAS